MNKTYLLLLTIFIFYLNGIESKIEICWPTSLDNFEKELEIIRDDDENSDNIQIDHIDFDFDHPALRAKGYIENVNVSNLALCELQILLFVNDTIKLFELTCPFISLEGFYDIDGNVGQLFDIFGTGPFWCNLIDFTVNMPVTFENGCVGVEVNVTLAKFENYFDNLMNDDDLEDLFNKVLTNLVPEVVDVIWNEWKTYFENSLGQSIAEDKRIPDIRNMLITSIKNYRNFTYNGNTHIL